MCISHIPYSKSYILWLCVLYAHYANCGAIVIFGALHSTDVVQKRNETRAKTIKWLIINAKWWQFAHEIGSFTSGYDVEHLLVRCSLSPCLSILLKAAWTFRFCCALSIQPKLFLFLFLIYVKIHFVFYSNAWCCCVYVRTSAFFLQNWDHIWSEEKRWEKI